MSPAAKKVEKPKTLAETLSEMRTKGKEPVGSLSDFEMVPRGLTTGNVVLDALTSVDGLPAGRITELIGPPSSGKTTCGLQVAAGVQAQGGNVVFLDYERSLDEDYCRALGINTEDPSFIYIQPNSFEHGANLFRKLLATGEVHLMLADSVAAMVTEAELGADTGKAEVMQRAKLMHQFCRQIAGPLHKTECAAVFLNHVMTKVDLSPMGQKMAIAGVVQKTSPGGQALPFYSSLRMEFKQMGNIREKGVNELMQEEETLTTATRTKVTVIKNKVGDPFRTAELRVHYGKGFSQEWSVLNVLVGHGVVKKTGAIYKYPEGLEPPVTEAFKGESRQVEWMETFPDWAAKLQAAAVDVIASVGLEKVDGSKYDKEGNEIDPDKVELSLLESVDLETGEIS
jgi:recombination protein RecA